MKKMLIAGGGHADIPLILAAKEMGFQVITSGNRPTDLGHAYSDDYHQVDFSDCQAICDLAEQLNVDAICACCNDFSALSVAYAAERLGLPGHDPYETAQVLHHKDRYRQFAQEHKIPTPRAIGCNTINELFDKIGTLSFPVIVKPVDLTGGKGVSVANTKEEALTATRKALEISKSKRIVVEEFIVGSRHGFSAFLYKGKVSFYFSDNEHYYLNPYMVAAASSPSIVPEDAEQELCVQTEKIADILSLKDGIFHVQYIYKDNKPIIIEICRRAPGDLYVTLVEHATGVNYPSWIVKAAAGMDCGGLKHSPTMGFLTRHCVMPAKQGIVEDIVFDDSIKDKIIDKFMWWKKGDTVTDVLTTKFGIVFLKFDTMEEMLTKTNALNELIKVQVANNI